MVRLQKYFGVLFAVSFGGLILGLAWIQRPSVCTNSKVVEKFDIISEKNLVSVPRCRFGDQQTFSQSTNLLIQAMDDSILPLERFLDNIRPFKNKVVFQISDERPLHFKATANQIELGRALLEGNYAERAFVKTWLLQGAPSFLSENQLILESLTDIYLFSYQGDLTASNILTGQRQNITDVPRWPLSIANLETYCRGAWVVPEHLHTCSQKIKDFTLSKNSEVVDWSLRPLLAKIWISTLKSLSMGGRKKTLELWSTLPGSIEKFDANDTREGLEKTFPPTVYEELVQTTRNVLHTLSRWSSVNIETDPMVRPQDRKAFLETLRQQIFLAGFQDYKNLPRFDFVLKIDIPISGDDQRLTEMKRISDMNPLMNMAVHAGGQLWLLPNLTAVSENTFAKIYTHRMIYESCHMNFKNLLAMGDTTEKILLVKSCHDSSPKKYTSFMTNGVSGFALQNPKTQFVQLHLPSLNLRKNILDPETDVYDAIGKRNLENPLFQALGWESLNWVETYRAYHPKAQIEAIEWFRLF